MSEVPPPASRRPQLVRAWRAWVRTPPPTERFRAGARGSPADDVECAIDHLVTLTDGLCRGCFNGKPWPFAELAANRLTDVERVEGVLDQTPLPLAERQRYRQYLEQTRDLLAHVREWAAAASM